MSSEGILVEDMFVTEDLKLLDSCLFAVHLQRKYSAYKELQTYVRLNDIDVTNTNDQDPASVKYLQALLVSLTSRFHNILKLITSSELLGYFQRGRDNERTLNDTYMRDKSGQCIVFGDIIQVRITFI